MLSEVADLINHTSGGWDVELVKDIFWQEDADLILALPVHEGRPNTLAWHYDKQGTFSVKSAYKVCRSDSMRARCKRGRAGKQCGNCNDDAEENLAT